MLKDNPRKSQIVRSSAVPLYQQLYEILRTNITQHEWKSGDMLPSETILMKQFDVSRVTVRQVLDMLVQEDLIYRERGRGTFVAKPRVEQALMRIISFTDDMHQRGIEPKTKLISANLVAAPGDIAKKLRIKTGEELVHIKRLRLGNDEPMSVEDSYLVHKYCPEILEEDFVANSLRSILENRCGIRWAKATQVIRAINAPNDLADLLLIKPKSALLFIERISFTTQDIPAEFIRIFHRGDRYALYNDLKG